MRAPGPAGWGALGRWAAGLKALLHLARALLGRGPAALGLMGLAMAVAAMLISAGAHVWRGAPAAYDALHDATGAPHAWFFLPEHPRREAAAAHIRAMPGVAAVPLELPVATLPLAGVGGERTVPARVYGVDAAGASAQGISGFAVVRGRWPTPGQAEALVDAGLAAALSLPVGGKAVISGLHGRLEVRVAGYTVSALHCPYPDCAPAVLLPRELFHLVAASPQTLVGVRLQEPQDASAFVFAARQELARLGVLADGMSFRDLKAHQRLSHSLTAGFLFLGGALALASGAAVAWHAVAHAAVAGRRVMAMARAIGCTPRQMTAAFALGCGAVGLLAAAAGSPAGWLAAQAWQAGSFGGAAQGARLGAELAGGGLWPAVGAALGVAGAAAVAGGWAGRGTARAGAGAALGAAGGGVPVQLGLRSAGSRPLIILRPVRSLVPALSVAISVATAAGAVTLANTMAAFEREPARLGIFHELTVERVAVERPPVRGDTSGAAEPSRLPPDAVDALLAADPDVSGFHREAWLRVDVPAARESIIVRGLDGDWRGLPWRVLGGRFVAEPGEIALGTTAMERLGVEPGDTIEVAFGPRRAALRVSGAYLELANAGIAGAVAWETFTDLQPGAEPTAWLVRLAPGADPETVRRRLLASGGGRLSVATAGFEPPAAVQAAGRLLDGLAALLGAMAIVAVVHGVAAAVREQRRDIAILKAIGMTPVQLTAATAVGVAAIAVVGTAAGIVTGVLLSLGGFWAASAVSGIGGLEPLFPWGQLAAIAAAAPVAAAIAAVPPAAVAAWAPATQDGGEDI